MTVTFVFNFPCEIFFCLRYILTFGIDRGRGKKKVCTLYNGKCVELCSTMENWNYIRLKWYVVNAMRSEMSGSTFLFFSYDFSVRRLFQIGYLSMENCANSIKSNSRQSHGNVSVLKSISLQYMAWRMCAITIQVQDTNRLFHPPTLAWDQHQYCTNTHLTNDKHTHTKPTTDHKMRLHFGNSLFNISLYVQCVWFVVVVVRTFIYCFSHTLLEHSISHLHQRKHVDIV